MKVSVIPSPRVPKEYTIELQQGAQYFRLDYTGSKTECRWYAKMFRVALKKHEESLTAKAPKPVRKPRIVKPMAESSEASA